MSERKKGRAPRFGSKKLSPGELARYIDQSLLSPAATEVDIIRLCKGAIKYNFYAVCVQPYYVPLCKAVLAGYDTKVVTVVGFPHGMMMRNVKIYEASQAVLYGAQELDIVINIGAVRSGNFDFITEEITEIVNATRSAAHKIILETCYLDDREKRAVAEIAAACGAGFVKTSTGFGARGATVKDVRLLKEIVKDRAGIKAAGGIKTLAQAVRFIDAGASRIGTSAGVEIMQEALIA